MLKKKYNIQTRNIRRFLTRIYDDVLAVPIGFQRSEWSFCGPVTTVSQYFNQFFFLSFSRPIVGTEKIQAVPRLWRCLIFYYKLPQLIFLLQPFHTLRPCHSMTSIPTVQRPCLVSNPLLYHTRHSRLYVYWLLVDCSLLDLVVHKCVIPNIPII